MDNRGGGKEEPNLSDLKNTRKKNNNSTKFFDLGLERVGKYIMILLFSGLFVKPKTFISSPSFF